MNFDEPIEPDAFYRGARGATFHLRNVSEPDPALMICGTELRAPITRETQPTKRHLCNGCWSSLIIWHKGNGRTHDEIEAMARDEHHPVSRVKAQLEAGLRAKLGAGVTEHVLVPKGYTSARRTKH